MKLAKMFLTVTLALAFGGSGSWGQTAPAVAGTRADGAQPAAKTYRLTYTLTETDGGKRVGTQHFSMIVVSGKMAILKQGSRVPIATEALNSGTVSTQFQYVDVGLRIGADLDIDGVKLNTSVEQSSIAEDKSGAGTQNPVIRQAILQGTSILIPGKPLMLGSMDVSGSTRRLDVEVVMEPVVQ